VMGVDGVVVAGGCGGDTVPLARLRLSTRFRGPHTTNLELERTRGIRLFN